MQFRLLNDDAICPIKGTQASAGYDLFSSHDATIIGGEGNFLVKTGIAVNISPDCYGRIAMRSGLALREHLAVSAGVIDKDYTGEIGVLVFCTKIGHTVHIPKGSRFAQLIPERVAYYDETEVKSGKQDTEGLHVGWGSTGLN